MKWYNKNSKDILDRIAKELDNEKVDDEKAKIIICFIDDILGVIEERVKRMVNFVSGC